MTDKYYGKKSAFEGKILTASDSLEAIMIAAPIVKLLFSHERGKTTTFSLLLMVSLVNEHIVCLPPDDRGLILNSQHE